MMNNVINFERFKDESKTPDDLMTLKELGIKHGFKYGYLYKWSCREKQITVYDRGTLYLSEKEVLEFAKKRALKYGGNK